MDMSHPSSLESPLIERAVWGEIEVAGLGRFRDVKLWPGGGRSWDWTETGTRHTPGIQSADVSELLDHGSRIIVLSKGMHERLGVSAEVLQYITDRGAHVYVDETRVAITHYNSLAESGEPVGGLFHSTC